jgi:Ca-activated chloride channel homolog
MRKVLVVLACLVSVFASAQLSMGSAQPMELAGTHLCGPLSPSCLDTIASAHMESTGFTLRKNVGEVRVRFSVTDKSGRYIPSITKNDFSLSDNGVQVAEFTDFREENDLPIQVAILIDSSRSTERELPMEKQLALEFLRNLLRPQDRAMIAGFNSHLKKPGTFTSRFNELEDFVSSMKAEGLTAFNDSIFELANDFDESRGARKVVIVITDGHDTVSAHTFSDARDSVLRKDVTVYTISINDKRALDPAASLADLSSQTGGHSYVLKDLKHLKQAFSQIDTDLRTSYVAAYRAPEGNRTPFHAINVQLSAKNLSVQNKKGYFRSE